MSLHFYHRTSANQGYSNGIFFEALRSWWPILVCLAVLGALIGALQGHLDSLIILVAFCVGGYWGFTRRR